MYLRQIALTNFRNYVSLGLDLSPGVTVFHGDNAQGKSNLLEAIHLLATTRSLRASVDRELMHWGVLDTSTPFARVEARIIRGSGELHVELLLRADPAQSGANGPSPTLGKTIKVNGLPSRAAQFVGQVNVVLFSPEDVALAAGPPAARRRYLDITNSQVDRGYLRALQRYNRVLVQRNQLLRQVRERRQPRELLAPWNDEQITLGSAVVAQRLAMVSAINELVGGHFRELSGTDQSLEIVYSPTSASGGIATGALLSGVSSFEGTRTEAVEAVASQFRARLEEVAARELEQAVSLIGPHRDDFAFLLQGVDISTYGSRGQQRLVVVALKLAEAEFMQRQTGERPILLLDDILSELDPARRVFVLERLGQQGQILITTTNLDDLSPAFLEHSELLRVSTGTIEATSRQTAHGYNSATPNVGPA